MRLELEVRTVIRSAQEKFVTVSCINKGNHDADITLRLLPLSYKQSRN
jgi:hypothetical protein